MNSESVDLIATDPPFNKGRDFHATPDSLASGAKFQDRWSWERDVHQEWLDKIKDDYPAVWEVIDAANAVRMRKTKKNLKQPRDVVGSDMGAFLCFMAVRLLEMHRVLRDDGSIFLHCDPTASHYLKAIMDAIFGWRNFRNEIVWCYTDPAGRKNTDYYKKTHDFIFWYAKDAKKCKTNRLNMVPLSESTIKRYGKYFDKQGQITYAALKMTNPGVFAALKGVPDDLNEVWMDRNKGTVAGDWWTDITPVRRKGGKQKPAEQVLWPTQKPLKLYRRLVETASYKDDIVLDPFAGCATACIAAEQLGRQWVAIDIWDKAKVALLHRLESEGMIHKSSSGQGHLFAKDILFTAEPPKRTDGGGEAAPFLRVKERIKEPEGHKMSRAEMYKFLLTQQGYKCQGCDREFDDPRYLELDHNTPRSDGGLNHISNRILLCSPCNRTKSNQYTLSGLRRINKRNEWMAK